MDPALAQLMAEGAPDDDVAVLLRLADPTAAPPDVRIVTQFGNIATCRLRRGDIASVHAAPTIRSVKAARYYGASIDDEDEEADVIAEAASFTIRESDIRRPDIPGLPTGKDVVVGHIDWGIDFVHPDFRNPDGTTRLLALWDQRGSAFPDRPNRYGYGRIFLREEIDRALQADDPYAALDYVPADFDTSKGTHGAHTMSISAGNDRAGGPSGIAPEADLCFVHFAPYASDLPTRLGDSVTYVEAIDMILRTAARQTVVELTRLTSSANLPVAPGVSPAPSPRVVINSSLGRQGGHHLGTSLVEQALDAALREAPGRAFVNSTGNYYHRGAHASGILRPGELDELRLRLQTRRGGTIVGPDGPVEMELWYPGADRFTVSMIGPDGTRIDGVHGNEQGVFHVVPEGSQAPREAGRLYHRLTDPNNGDNEVVLYLFRDAPAGEYVIGLFGDDVADGRYHAWIERNEAGRRSNATFAPGDIDATHTTGTICNGFRTIAVGAYDAHAWRNSGDVPATGRPIARFSSSGPTRDGRQKPDLCAPGVQVLAARSRPRDWPGKDDGVPPPMHSRMSGTSMAAPHVTGTVALMFEAAGRPLAIEETRRLLLASTDSMPGNAPVKAVWRIGNGYLNTAAAVEAARAIQVPAAQVIASAPVTEVIPEAVPDDGAIPLSVEVAPAMTHSDAENAEFFESIAEPIEAEPEGLYPEYYPEYYADDAAGEDDDELADDEEFDEAEEPRSRSRFGRSRRRSNDLPFSFVVPLGGGGIAPALTVPVGGSGSPFAFALPLGGTTAPATTTTAVPVMPVMPMSPMSGYPGEPVTDAPIVVADPSQLPFFEMAGVPAAGSDKSGPASYALNGFSSESMPESHHNGEWAEDEETFGERVVTVADLAASNGRTASPRSSTMLATILGAMGRDANLSPLGARAGHVPSATELFNAFALAGDARQRLRSHYARQFQPIALPGRRIQEITLRPGDVMVRIARGEGWGQFSVISEPHVLDAREAGGPQPGGYVRVIEWLPVPHRRRDRFARRLAGSDGTILPDTLVLRVRPVIAESAESEPGGNARPATLARGATGSAVRELQTALNAASTAEAGAGRPPLDSTPLKVNGTFGEETENAVRDFQLRQFADDASQWTGVAGPETWQKLDAATGKDGTTPPAAKLPESYGLETDSGESTTHTPDLSDAFFAMMHTVAATLGTDPEYLLAVMNSESGIKSTAHNPNGHASGLIQFMPATLVRLGWTQGHEAFRHLTADEQMPFVQRYYVPYVPQGLNSTARLYQATFLPATLGRGSDPDTVLVDVNRNDNAFAYEPNNGLDRRKDGRILVGDLTAFVERAQRSARWREALDRLRASMPGPVPPGPIPVPPVPVPVPVPPVPVPVPATSHPVLRRGARGDAVREAQTKLNAVHARLLATGTPGLQGAPLAVDGVFGALTYNAVVSFQQQAFPATPPEWDGVIGPKTWAQLDAHAGAIAPVPLIAPEYLDESWDYGEQAAINWCQVRQTIARIARHEERQWTRPNGTKIVESDPAMLQTLASYWATVPGFQTPQQALNAARQSAANQVDFPWSAAFICFVMHSAGVRRAHGFEFGQRHLAYIVEALRNRERSDRNRVFWLTDHLEIVNEAAPQPGDLLCFNRCCASPGTRAANGCPVNTRRSTHTYSNLRQRFWGPGTENTPVRGCSHTAIVIGTTVRNGRRFVQTIGGNEGNSVRINSAIELNEGGGIRNPADHHVFGMIKIIAC